MNAALGCLTNRRRRSQDAVAEAENEIARLEEQIEAQRKYIADDSADIIELDAAIAKLSGTGA